MADSLFIPPVRRIFTGNRNIGPMFTKYALSKLDVLDQDIERHRLNGYEINEKSAAYYPETGVTVECFSRFGSKEIRVHVDPSVVIPALLLATDEEEEECIEKETIDYEALPLVLGGYKYTPPEEGLKKEQGHQDCFYSTVSEDDFSFASFSRTTPFVEDEILAQYYTFQVKYEAEAVDVNNTDVDKIFTLTIHCGWLELGGVFYTVNRYKASVADADYLEKILGETTITTHCNGLVEVDDGESDYSLDIFENVFVHYETALSANFNHDFTQLYVAYGRKSDTLGNVYCDVNVIIYNRVIDPETGAFSWETEIEVVYGADYFMNVVYVDRDGMIWGFYKTEEVDSTTVYSYATMDIISGDLSDAESMTVGYSVTEIDGDGDFAGIHKTFETSVGDEGVTQISGTKNYLLNNSESQDTSSCVPAGMIYVPDSSDSVGTVEGGPNEYRDGVCDDITWVSASRQWAEFVNDMDIGGQALTTVTVGGYELETKTGTNYLEYSDATTYRRQEGTWYNIKYPSGGGYVCKGAGYEGRDIRVYEQDYNREYTDLTDYDAVTNGAITHTYGRSGYSHHYEYTDAFNYDVVTASWVSMYASPLVGRCTHMTVGGYVVGDIEEITVNLEYPFLVENAYGTNTFIAWDNNDDGLIIKGVRYADYPSGDLHLRVEINEQDITNDLIALTGFNPDLVHYLGFKF